jgi:ABC-type nickel/cobalt efflux system permease component RcnA
MSYGIYIYGIISIIGMAIGAAITVGTTGYIVLVGKEKAMNLFGSQLAEKIAFGLRYCGGLFLLALGLVMVAP